MDDDTAEMGKIETLADVGVIRDLEMIFSAQSVEPVIVDCELDLRYLPADPVKPLDLVIIVTGAAHNADITELRGRTPLLEVAGINILIASGISGIPEQIRIYDVLEFICHSVSFPSF